MTFKVFVPYNQLELNIMEALNGSIREFYPTIDELIEEEGECDYIEILISGVTIQLNNNFHLSLDNISLN
jgi:hypothetical protein